MPSESLYWGKYPGTLSASSKTQYGNNFIGYEATARMSELANIYSNILIVGKEGRFRTLEVDWEKEKEIKDIKEILDSIGDEDGDN